MSFRHYNGNLNVQGIDAGNTRKCATCKRIIKNTKKAVVFDADIVKVDGINATMDVDSCSPRPLIVDVELRT